ncbi:unnamed protein product [Mytilus edulis]|uniref:C1q domain-containing protein n=1 Tax=Mytilus edulis TaxID=6550 RepID=A0A8S3VI09_MYTED|nr:unnamed protein product [Mytilus edulis]
MENTIHGQEVHIKRLTERLNNMETKLKKNEQKCDKSNWWNLKELGLQVRHSVIQNTDSTLKDRHLVLGNEPVRRNRYNVNTSQNEDKPGKHHTIIFDIQKTNVGNGYSPFSGLFTAPQDGLYAFATSITMGHHYASFEFVKNANIQGSFFVDASITNEWRSSSSTVVLALVQGDVVFVRTSSTYVPHGNIHSSKDGRSSFTGWLID